MQITDNALVERLQTAPALTADELQRLAYWNSTEMEYPRDKCIQHLVSEQAEKTPDAVALRVENKTLSYGMLYRRSNQLAHLLQSCGVQTGTRVGVCLERSQELVVGLLGILKAGGAYVPMDPDYPVERLSFMMEDAQIPLLVTQQEIAARLPVEGICVICLDTDEALLSRQSEQTPHSSVTADDLAYVIYTSGSTGRPKGAQITHNNLLNLMFWHQKAFSVTASDRATQVASPAFDATGWELWPYLTVGAEVHFIDRETRLHPVLLRDWLLERRITITFLPTALAESVIMLEWPSTAALRFLLTGADALRRYPAASLSFAFINNYGLSETGVVSTSGQIYPTEHTDSLPSIGRPIANTRIYILDEDLNPVPIGTAGELCIGGESVGRGYLNRPELTAQRFVPDPFRDTTPGAVLYRTGDVARFRQDGQIEFMGRNDQQIKIRGYRIEPNEIVSVLNEQPSLVTSYVLAREDTPGERRLVAYIVIASGASVSVAELAHALAERLPEYMIPAVFVSVEALPVTPNGKVDSAVLPTPDAINTLHDVAIAARTPVEERVAEIVAGLLGIEEVGIDDNFFLLGGHSLLATQLIMRLTDMFGVTLTLRTLFDAPTVREVSQEIEQDILRRVEAMSDEEIRRMLEEDSSLRSE